MKPYFRGYQQMRIPAEMITEPNTTMTGADLSVFFDEVIPYVMGERSAAEIEASLGPSATGTRHLEVYAGVVRTNIESAMASVYSAVKHAADAIHAGLWQRLTNEFFATWPPRHFDPNLCGEPMASFLRSRRYTDMDVPAFLEELADYEWTCFRAATASQTGFDHSLFVRRYDHAIPDYVRALESDHPTSVPAPEAVTVIVFRSVKTQRVEVLHPTKAQLLALAQREGELEQGHVITSGVTNAELFDARRSLAEAGLFDKESIDAPQ
jgi:hypothetical protein